MQQVTINPHSGPLWVKFLVVFAAALATTMLCFYLMMFLITHELSPEVEFRTPPHVTPAITEPREEKPVATRERPWKIMPLEPPPNPRARPINRITHAMIPAERPTFGSMADIIGLADIQLELKAPNSELMPVYVVQPAYPLRASMREIEGYVIVQFSVKEDGSVLNPFIIRSEPEVIFDESALAAISRFRFKPREVGGDPVRVDDVQLKFVFNLQSLYAVQQP